MVPGDDLVDLDFPAHGTGVAHPFGMSFRILLCDLDAALHVIFGAEAVPGFNYEGNTCVDLDILPGEEAVQLNCAVAPCAALDHHVRWLLSGSLIFGKLAEYGRYYAFSAGIAEEVFNEKGFFLAGFFVDCGE